MDEMVDLSCRCGKVHVEARGVPIVSAECYCASCRDAAGRIAGMAGHQSVVGANGSTHFVLYRKDRLTITQGKEWLRNFRLGPDRQTRRVIATCCDTPVLLEFKGGHWASLYANLWHGKVVPVATLRTQVGSVGEGVTLDDAVPSGGWQTARFFGKLFSAWAAMGFKAPTLELDTPEITLEEQSNASRTA